MADSAPLKEARWDLRWSIVLTVMNIVALGSFWFTLPMQIKNVSDKLEDHELRLRKMEEAGSTQASMLSRIDERTKAIQDNVTDLRRDFSFRASAKP